MNSAVRLGQTVNRVSIRGFHTSRARLSGPHYPEGPRHNVPWTPKGRWNIRLRLFGFFGFGFSLPLVASWWQLHKINKHFGDPAEVV